MASPLLHAALEGARARMQAALEEQLSAIDAACQATVAEAHAAAHAAADQRRAAQFENLPAGSTAQGSAASTASIADSPPASDSARAALRRLADAFQALSAATSLSTALDCLAGAAQREATRTALFVVSGPTLERWRTSGFNAGQEPAGRIDLAAAGPLAQAVETGHPIVNEATAAPAFAAGTAGVAAPLLVGGRCVAVLYADVADPGGLALVHDTIGLLAQHASTCLAHVTAAALATAAPVGPAVAAAPSRDDDSSARRYARLLVSEIRLYNEAAVRVGRERRDLLTRLRPEIERARRLYEERVPDAAGSRHQLFQQELVQTLAEGDPALLGASD